MGGLSWYTVTSGVVQNQPPSVSIETNVWSARDRPSLPESGDINKESQTTYKSFEACLTAEAMARLSLDPDSWSSAQNLEVMYRFSLVSHTSRLIGISLGDGDK
ncbi:hypothetical protein RRG08_007033 [Elysia crispata]|uniref:Uncharacterized protein n=1 Tax=Elysia crispata TaxID=231223 RepID=A0AAE0ZJ75_9GAST|nr:hypothetical protein RRG08_007033 [Elysia crispata]